MEFKAKGVKKLTVSIGDKTYEMDMPKFKHQRQLAKDSEGLKDGSSDQIEVMVKWLVSLGLPEEVLNEFCSDDVVGLCDVLSSGDKKK